jgi:O-antigen ligase
MELLMKKRLTKLLAVFVTGMVCLTRLSMAAGEILNGIAVLIGIIILYKNYKSISIPREIRGYCTAYFIFVISTLPSVLFTGDIWAGMHEFLQMWFWRFAVFILIVTFIHTKKYLVNMLTVFIAVFGVDCLLTLIQVLFHLGNNDRGWGFGGSQLNIASIMCMVMPIVTVIICDASFDEKLKKVSLFTFFSICIGLICNKSRGSWISNLILVPFSAWLYIIKSKKKLAMILSVFIFFGIFFSVVPQYTNRFESITNTVTDHSNSDRIWGWKSCIDMYIDHPIIGIGLGQFHNYYQSQYKYPQETQGLNHAHNNFFQLLAETGTIGILGLLYFIGYFIVTSFNNWKKDKNPYDLLIMTTVLGFIGIFGQIEYTLDLSSCVRIFWFLLAILLAMKNTKKHHDLL